SWNGFPPIISQYPDLLPVMNALYAQGQIKVNHYQQSHPQKEWLPFSQWPMTLSQQQIQQLMYILQPRQLSLSGMEDELGWGSQSDGSYIVAEGYTSLAGPLNHPWANIFRKIWQS
ncbi:hypothetical protein KI387_042464, partial [Taxus chinensis]